MVSLNQETEIDPAGISRTAPLSAHQPEGTWQRIDRYASYVFFALFGGGGMIVPLAIMIYSWFL